MTTKLITTLLLISLTLPACASDIQRHTYPRLGEPTSSVYLQIDSRRAEPGPIINRQVTITNQHSQPSGNNRHHDDWKDDFREDKMEVLNRLNHWENQIDRMQRCVKHADSYRELKDCQLYPLEERWEFRHRRNW